ncbi:MAG: chorismate mutase [Pseudomonadota bacterium]
MKHCTTMAEVRAEIDRLDRQLVGLIAERVGYIEAAARIKPERSQVRDEWRITDVLNKVRATARKVGAPEALVEMLYKNMVEWCIAHEFKVFDQRNGASGHAKARALK